MTREEIEEERIARERVAATELAKPMLKKQVDSIQELSKSEKKQVKKNLDNPEKVKQATSLTGIPSPNLTDQFTEALTFFTPELLGSALGGVFGGTEAALMGMEAGGQARDKYLKYKMDKERLTLEEKKAIAKATPKQKTFQQADMLFTRDGKPLIFDPNEGSFRTSDGNKVASENIRALQVDAEGRRKLVSMNDIAKSKQLSDRQIDTIKGFEASLISLDNVDRLKKDIDTGVLAGTFQSGLEYIGQASPEFTQLKAESENIKAEFLKALSGAQVSDAEAKRLANIIPNVADQDNVFSAKSTAFRNILERHRNAIAKAIQDGQPLKRDTIDEMLKVESRFSAGDTDQSSSIRPEIRNRINNRTPEQNQMRLQELKKKYGR